MSTQRAVTDLASAADGADILIFVVPHQFIRALCKQLNGKMKKSAIAVSLIKVIVEYMYMFFCIMSIFIGY